MPVMNGEEALAHVKRIRPDVKVVVSSGYDEMEAIQRYLNGGGKAMFLVDPAAVGLEKFLDRWGVKVGGDIVIDTSGAGRLSSNYGSGTWRGAGSSSSCEGSWTAERR